MEEASFASTFAFRVIAIADGFTLFGITVKLTTLSFAVTPVLAHAEETTGATTFAFPLAPVAVLTYVFICDLAAPIDYTD